MSFCSIINFLFQLLKDPKMRKYAIKKPLNLKSILKISIKETKVNKIYKAAVPKSEIS